MTFTVASLILAVAFLCYFITSELSRMRLKKHIQIAESALNKAQEVEYQLRDELTTLKIKLQHAFEDPVTHLSGWQLFEDRLAQHIKECKRYQMTLGLLFVDVDDFKRINDVLGYEVGDELLRQAAARIQACIRQVDSVSRFTKDTFVVLLAQLSKPETAAIVAQRILQALAQSFEIKEHELFITAGIGIAIYPQDADHSSSLLQSADHALTLAKEKGKHLYQFYHETIHTKSMLELALYTSLSRESIYQEFAIYYQPIVNVQGESVACMEALLHWQHPTGLIPPEELLVFAERQGKLNPISEWLLRNACKQFLHWRSLGFYPELIGIPLSIKQLQNTRFIYRLSQILQEVKFKSEWLLVELMETTMAENEAMEKALEMLKYLGIKTSLNNFGANPFALRHLKSFAFDYLKLDPFFIEDLASNKQSIAIVKSTIFLVESLSSQVIAQGVETPEQKQLLQDLGCHLMQGNLLGKPLSEQEVAEKMAPVV